MGLLKKKSDELPPLEETAGEFVIADGEDYINEIFENDMRISRSFTRLQLDEKEYRENYSRVIQELLATGEHKFFVAVDRYGRYLGHVWVCLRVDTVDFVLAAYIFDIETLFPGIGIGSALLERAEEWAQAMGVKKVSLRVELDNTASEWYRRKGYRDRAVVMEKPL
ncbi:GNAT family N-acetyltransferase [Thermococcus aciditolerans]|uniref:GNAT family N-acetyltransferase n=1 Tax=Thermococcus aciditolerans TaxID=2598455 RepID=A0A5C0SHQ6_9EURY|nr:GNAT family N-acetyltransferase [Thermococcus aciditolerans]QEK13861.1 GNAT family N-acetyltransferase [Thermococcus aciditolerans]